MLRSFAIPWAADRWFGEDKLTHFAWCYAGAFSFPHVLPWLLALVVVTIAAVVVELVQWLRWDIWANGERAAAEWDEPPPPRPAFADQPSYRDLAYNAVGMVVGFASWVLVR